MSESVFHNLVRGNKLTNYLGLRLPDNAAPLFGTGYAYVELRLGQVEVVSGLSTTKKGEEQDTPTSVKKGQTVLLSPLGSVTPTTYTVIIKTNPLLQAVASLPPLYLLDPGMKEEVGVYATFRKDYDLAELDWLVRVYMLR